MKIEYQLAFTLLLDHAEKMTRKEALDLMDHLVNTLDSMKTGKAWRDRQFYAPLVAVIDRTATHKIAKLLLIYYREHLEE